MRLKVEDVEEMVVHLEDIKSDDEGAHAFEDDIWEAVLKAIAEGRVAPDDVEKVCAAALATKKVEFHRWCA